MRLLERKADGNLVFHESTDRDVPAYAILSHTWLADNKEEVSFQDVEAGIGKSKAGWRKIQFCADKASADGLRYFWIDTCCIDKASHAELAEAIVSMFRWYRRAEQCYVYLSDISVDTDDNYHQTGVTWESDFRKSRWFTRGWTLQELLAPKSVHFFSREGNWLGDRNILEQQIHEITSIPLMALRGVSVSNFSVSERMRWAAKRNTAKPEDKAYCLLGIFDVFMAPIYGEGANAFIRLQNKIDKRSGSRVNADKLLHIQRPSPIWHVPFDRQSGFVGRTDEMEQLKQRILDPTGHRIVSILGLGGAGKSRLALEVVHQLKSEYPRQSSFWIEATNRLSFERDIREVGKKLEIPGIEDDKADTKMLVKQWLSNTSEDRWLLVLDNADDEAIWGKGSNLADPKSSLMDCLPSTANGSILITTRSHRVANHLAGKEVIRLPTMSVDEARKMLANTLENPEVVADENLISVLLDKLTYLPLAIIQAASYINMTQEPLETYLDLLDEPEEEVVRLLSEDFGDRSRYFNAHNAVTTTWLISFNQIRKHHPLAAGLLSSMACLHEKNIPQSLLPEIGSKKDTIDAFATLRGYSFITRQTGGKRGTCHEVLYDMHRLIHLAARNWLRIESSLGDWTRSSLKRIAELFPTHDYQHKDTWTIYLPHAQYLCEESKVMDLPERYKLLKKMGLCFVADGKYDAAVKAHAAVVQWSEKGSDISEEQMLEAYNNLGDALYWSGDLNSSEIYLEKALKGQKKVNGMEHTSTLTSMANLASTYRSQGQWGKAEELEMQVMGTRSKVLGAEHPDTLRSMCSLANVLSNQGKYKQAEEIHQQTLELSKRVLRAEHPDTLKSMNDLANVLSKQGKYKQAEEIYQQTLELRKRVLGAEHPDTLISINNLANILSNQGKYKQAEEIYQQTLKLSKRVLGAKHPDTLWSMNNLANVLSNQGKDKQAEEIYQQTLELSKRVLGAKHPDTLWSMNNLANVLSNQGKDKQAEEIYQQTLELRKRVLGAEHPDTLWSMDNLAILLSNQGKYKQAEEMLQQTLKLSKRVLGAEHPDTLMTMNNLANVLRNQGKDKQAEEMLQQTLELRKRVLGAEHPDTLMTMNNLANVLRNQGKDKQAEEMLQQTLELRKRVLGAEHPDTLASMNNLANMLSNQGKYKQAEEMLQQTLELSKRVLGAEHPDTLRSMNNLARVLRD